MKKLWKYIQVLITVVVVALFVIYFVNNKEDLQFLLSLDWRYLLLMTIFWLSIIFLNGVFIKVILKSFEKTISVLESFYISVISMVGNYFLPARGGAVIRSVYLKKNYNFPYSHFISTLYGYYILVFLINSFLALIALGANHFLNSIVSIPLYIFFGALFISMLILSLVKFPIKKIGNIENRVIRKIVLFIENIFNGWNMIASNKKLLFYLLLLSLGNYISSLLLFWAEFQIVGLETNILNLIIYTCLSGVSLLISITPGSLGIREAVFLVSSQSIGLNQEEILQLAVVDRGSLVVLLSILVLFFTLFIRKFNLADIFVKNEKV
jgi:uncharacterized protein (TIRG00374 family)